MAEIQLTKIRSIYGDIKGLLSQIPQSDKESYVVAFVVNGFNKTIDELSQITDTDYSRYKITREVIAPSAHREIYYINPVRIQIGRVISRLEEEYGFGRENDRQSPNIAIFNKNQNEVSLKIDYTINELIDKNTDEESKNQLRELRDELEKKDKNWNKIKSILIWIINFSKDLFLEVLPIILQKIQK